MATTIRLGDQTEVVCPECGVSGKERCITSEPCYLCEGRGTVAADKIARRIFDATSDAAVVLHLAALLTEAVGRTGASLDLGDQLGGLLSSVQFLRQRADSLLTALDDMGVLPAHDAAREPGDSRQIRIILVKVRVAEDEDVEQEDIVLELGNFRIRGGRDVEQKRWNFWRDGDESGPPLMSFPDRLGEPPRRRESAIYAANCWLTGYVAAQAPREQYR